MATNLNPSLLTVLLESVATGNIRAANIMPSINANQVYAYGDTAVRFLKEGSGHYRVDHYKGDTTEVVMKETATSPAEAKLLVIDALVRAAVEKLKADRESAGDKEQQS